VQHRVVSSALAPVRANPISNPCMVCTAGASPASGRTGSGWRGSHTRLHPPDPSAALCRLRRRI